MALRKVAVDNSVKYIAQSEQSREREIKTNMIKKKSLPCEQNKKLSQNNEKFIAGGSG